MKKFWCWLNGHKWEAITDPNEIRAEIARWQENKTRLPYMCKCARCGVKE